MHFGLVYWGPSIRGQGPSPHRVLLTAATCTLVLQAAAENAALRALKQAQLATQKEADAAAKKAELQAAAADPWLNEDPQQAASALSPVRVSTCSRSWPHGARSLHTQQPGLHHALHA
jgi:hypothetical protein